MRRPIFLIALILPTARGADNAASCLCSVLGATPRGWCIRHHCGLAYGIPVQSRLVFAALAAQPFDPAAAACPTCRSACAADGNCDACKLHFAAGRAYKSWLAAAFERGRLVPPEQLANVECETCRIALDRSWAAMRVNTEKLLLTRGPREVRAKLRAGRAAAATQPAGRGEGALLPTGAAMAPARLDAGFCGACDRGVVSGRLFVGRAAYDRARAALSALKSCPEYNCEMCSIMLLTDGDCRCCNRRFRGGFFRPIVERK